MEKKINNLKNYKAINNIPYPNERNLDLENDYTGFLAIKEEEQYSELFKPFEGPGDEEFYENSEENSFPSNYYLFLNEVLNDSIKKAGLF